jgi:hypothetical protein
MDDGAAEMLAGMKNLQRLSMGTLTTNGRWYINQYQRVQKDDQISWLHCTQHQYWRLHTDDSAYGDEAVVAVGRSNPLLR